MTACTLTCARMAWGILYLPYTHQAWWRCHRRIQNGYSRDASAPPYIFFSRIVRHFFTTKVVIIFFLRQGRFFTARADIYFFFNLSMSFPCSSTQDRLEPLRRIGFALEEGRQCGAYIRIIPPSGVLLLPGGGG